MIVWFFIDMLRYVRFKKILAKLNKCVTNDDVNEKNTDIFCADLEEHPIMCCENITDLFYGKSIENVSVDEVIDSTISVTGLPNAEKFVPKLRTVLTNVCTKMKQYGYNILQGKTMENKRLHFSRSVKTAWFHVLPLVLILELLHVMSSLYLFFLGYKREIMHNDMIIWYKHNKTQQALLVFYPCIIGGITLYPFAVNKLKHNNILIPEIPGLSFYYTTAHPPKPSEVVDTVALFIDKHFAKQKDNVTIAGHSFGNIMCNCMINKYPNLVKKYICIEGQLFFHGFASIFFMLEKNIQALPYTDLVSVLFFQRNIWAVYYIHNLISISECFLYSKPVAQVFTYHVEDDDKIDFNKQLEYAVAKNIPLSYKIFKGSYGHGAFVLNFDVQKYVLADIQDIVNKFIDTLYNG